ncbi:MAG: UDP-N-acetylglucosamine 2-epimerase (non-hydrolyzing), partial [Bacteroidota bacterium]
CLTLRPNTERPVTITQGTNSLCTANDVETMADEIISGKYKKGTVPDLWDGQTSARIVKHIMDTSQPK